MLWFPFERVQRTVNLLFLGGARRVSLAERFIRSAKELGTEANIFSYELTENVPISATAKIIAGLKWKDKNVFKHLAEAIEKNNIHIVLPFLDPATVIAAQLKEIHKGIFIPVSDETTCKTFFDKIKANKWFNKNRYPVPENTNQLPLIAKLRNGSASKDIVAIKTKKELELFKKNPNQKNYLIQKYIEGEEYSVDCYVSKDKNILAVVPRKRIEIISGEVTQSRTVRDEKIIELSSQILNKSGIIGPATIQFIKENTTGEIYLTEINPRFGGGVIVSIEAGADIPSMILKDYLGIPNKPVYIWKENLLMMRAYREFFHYADNN